MNFLFRFQTKLRQKYFSKTKSEYPDEFYRPNDGLIAQKCTLKDYEDFYILAGFLFIVSVGDFHVQAAKYDCNSPQIF